MNTKSLRLIYIKTGTRENNTFLATVDTDTEEITPFYLEEEYIFQHITGKKKSDVTEIEGEYAKMFLLHNLNLVVVDGDYMIRIVYKLDGTIINYGV